MNYIKLYKAFESTLLEKKDIRKHSKHLCDVYNIKNYTINNDGSIDVDGDVNLMLLKLKELPLQFNHVSGSFYCSENKLTSLKGSPKYVGGSFLCQENKLTTLQYLPEYIGINLYCNENKLTKLDHLGTINGLIVCSDNKLKELTKGYNYSMIHNNPISYLLEALIESGLTLNYVELIDRLDEFEVIKDGNIIDLISLNSLFDFCKIPFDEEGFKEIHLPDYKIEN